MGRPLGKAEVVWRMEQKAVVTTLSQNSLLLKRSGKLRENHGAQLTTRDTVDR